VVDQQALGRVLKEAMKGGKYTVGTKEVISQMKTSKLVIAAKMPPSVQDGALAEEAAKNKVPIVTIDKSSSQLGRMLGRPYRVAALGVRVVAENDLRLLTSE
jgi:ribosomal protein L30E